MAQEADTIQCIIHVDCRSTHKQFLIRDPNTSHDITLHSGTTGHWDTSYIIVNKYLHLYQCIYLCYTAEDSAVNPLSFTLNPEYPVNHIVIPLLAGKHHKKLLGAEQLS